MSAPTLRVLVIDDEPPIRKLLRMGLTTQGYQVVEAQSGKAALEMIGYDGGPVRAPLRPLSATARAEIQSAITKIGE